MNKCLNCGKPVENKYCGVSCQNKHQNTERSNKRYGEYKPFQVNCSNCGEKFEVEEREKLFPKKEKYYCSRSCANKRTHSIDTKNKISDGLITYYSGNSNYNKKVIMKSETKKIMGYNHTCEECGGEFQTTKRNQRFCSRTCAITWRNKHQGLAQKGGRASVNKQVRCSKNEIYFAHLCEKRFNKILTNEPIFNGWDADVIIEDLKIAVLWNGKWHYEKITEKHSVEQVKNRDKIKIKEILKKGYTPYIIKDMGKANRKFVDDEFEKFLNSI